MSETREYWCPNCEAYRKTRTDGRREFCAECGKKANAKRWVKS